MSAGNDRVVRTEDWVGPFADKHALVVDKIREVHLGAQASDCPECREAKRLASQD